MGLAWIESATDSAARCAVTLTEPRKNNVRCRFISVTNRPFSPQILAGNLGELLADIIVWPQPKEQPFSPQVAPAK